MVRLDSVSKWFSDRQVLDSVSLNLIEGKITGIIGPAASGKSVLLKIMAGVLPPDVGEVTIADSEGQVNGSQAGSLEQQESDTSPKLAEKAEENDDDRGFSDKRVGFLFQEGALFDSVSVLENVAFPLMMPDRVRGVSKRARLKAYSRAEAALESVGLKAHIAKQPGQLSGGMRRRVGIARAIVSRPHLLLLDEPTGGLDPVTSSRILDLVISLQLEMQNTMVIVSHDIRRLLPAVHHLVGVFKGQIRCHLPIPEVPERAPLDVLRFLSKRYDFSVKSG